MGTFVATLKALKFPVKLLIGWKRKRPKKTEREQKQSKHVRNFTPTHYSWQQKAGKKLTKKQKEYYRKRQNKNKK